MSTAINAAIVGAQGYTGLTLARLIKQHPMLKLACVYSRSAQWQLSQDLGPSYQLVPTCAFDTLLQSAGALDVIFFATPASVSLTWIHQLMSLYPTLKIVDLSGAYRLPEPVHAQHYPPHPAPKLTADYGLVPWVTPKTSLISNPGCYATATLMALLPLIDANVIATDSLIVDAKSGISGAGRSAKTALLFSEVENNFYPYKIGAHQHQPEVETQIQALCGQAVSLTFTTHILPIKQGISLSIYADVQNASGIDAAFRQAYQQYPFVHVQNLASGEASPYFLQLQSVIHTPMTHISFQLIQNKLYICCCLDNLYKGAASQAIENCNIAFNWPLETGLSIGESS